MALNYMPFYVGDFLRDTTELSANEIGSYILLICAYWTNGGPLPYDLTRLTRIVRSQKGNQVAGGLVRRFFTVSDGMIFHKRIDIELEKSKTAYKKRCLGAKKTNAKRHAERNAVATQPEPYKVLVVEPYVVKPGDNRLWPDGQPLSPLDEYGRAEVKLPSGAIIKIAPTGTVDVAYTPLDHPPLAFTRAEALAMRKAVLEAPRAE